MPEQPNVLTIITKCANIASGGLGHFSHVASDFTVVICEDNGAARKNNIIRKKDATNFPNLTVQASLINCNHDSSEESEFDFNGENLLKLLRFLHI